MEVVTNSSASVSSLAGVTKVSIHLQSTRNEVVFSTSQFIRPQDDEAKSSSDTPFYLYRILFRLISDKWKLNDSVKEKRCVLRGFISGAAPDVLGHQQHKQPDCYNKINWICSNL